jgi:beta-phosphoglucomutase-like phosphatase (HAD superfamily)
MLSAIVFDFDGVLANSEPLHYQSYRSVLAEEDLTLAEPDYYARYLGFDDVGAFRAIARDHGRTWSDRQIADLLARKADRMAALERDISVLFPGAAEAVRLAAATVPIAIASGALRAEILRVLDREGLTGCFTAIVAAGDTPVSKPAPDPYLRALALLRAARGRDLQPRACVALEDSRWGLESARTAGLRTIGVAQTYPASVLNSADMVIASVADFDMASVKALCDQD